MDYFPAEETIPIPTKDILSWLFDDQEYDPYKPIWIDAANPSQSVSSRQARTLIRQLVAGLRAAGHKPGDCVCLHSFNNIYYSILFLGVIAAGGVFTGANPAYTPHELSHQIRIAEVKIIITEPELLDNVLAAAKETHIPKEKIFVFDALNQEIPTGFRSWRHLLQYGEQDWVRFNDLDEAKQTTAARFFSSGTTGLPKAANITHYNLVAQHTLTFEFSGPKPYESRRLHVLPEFHMAAVPSIHIAPLRAAHTCYVMRRFELESYLSYLERFQINEIVVVPPLVIAIIMSPLSQKYSLRSLRDVACGAAPLGKEPQSRFRALLDPSARVTQAWGMTESCCAVTMFWHPENDTTGSVGRLIPNTEAKLVDDDGRNITNYDVSGEIYLRGPCIMPGYHRNEEANISSFDSEGWYKTGDVGYCDSRTKKWYILDRKKEFIKVRGFQVAPLEIEAVLLGHPHIIDAAVIGIRLSPEIELPRAYVVRRPGVPSEKLTEKDVKHYSSQRLAKYKSLDGGVRFVNSIPKNSTGKTLKRELREQAQAEIGEKTSKL